MVSLHRVYALVACYTARLKLLLCAGAAGLCSAIMLASFAREPYQVLLTQGVLYGLSASIMFNGTFSLVPEWFVRRRGLASGVCYAGLSNAPLTARRAQSTAQALLSEEYSYRTSLLHCYLAIPGRRRSDA